jgi:hypothetical protein
MNLAFAYLVNAVLLTRLPLFLADGPVRGRRVLAAAAVQLAALALLAPAGAVALAAAVIVAVNAAAWLWERGHAAGGLMAARLVALAAFVAGLGVLCSAFGGLGFRADLAALGARAGLYFVLAGVLATIPWRAFHGCLLGALLSLNEANLVVRLVVETFVLRPASGGRQRHALLERREYNRGRMIGLLERLLVFTLVLVGQYGALGFVIATKGLARFKDLDHREFAEYFLIGTMLSIVLAGGIALIVKHAVL